MLLVVQEAVFGADHDGNLAEMHIGEQALLCLALAALGVVDERGANTDIYEEGRGVGEIAHAGVIGHHGKHRAVVLEDGGLAETDILEHEIDLILVLGRAGGEGLRGATHEGIRGGRRETCRGCEGGAGTRERNLWAATDDERIHLLNDFRDIDIHEMVEGLHLVRNDLSPLGLLEIQIQHVAVRGQHGGRDVSVWRYMIGRGGALRGNFTCWDGPFGRHTCI